MVFNPCDVCRVFRDIEVDNRGMVELRVGLLSSLGEVEVIGRVIEGQHSCVSLQHHWKFLYLHH